MCFFLHCLTVKMKTLWYFRMPGATHPVTQYHIPEEDLNLKQQHSQNSRQNLWHFDTWYPGVLSHEIWTNLKCFRKFDKSHFHFWKVIFNFFSLVVTCTNLVACLTCTHPSPIEMCGLWCLRGTQPSARPLWGVWFLILPRAWEFVFFIIAIIRRSVMNWLVTPMAWWMQCTC